MEHQIEYDCSRLLLFFLSKNGVKCNLCTHGSRARNNAIAITRTVAESILRAHDLLLFMLISMRCGPTIPTVTINLHFDEN